MGNKKKVNYYDKDFLHSSMRETIFEHKFIGDFLSHCWQQSRFDVEVLRSEIDDAGYDLVISIGKITSYLQLKVTAKDTDTSEFPIHEKLINKERSFILLIEYNRKDLSEFIYYLMSINRRTWNEVNKGRSDSVRMIKRTVVSGFKNKDRESRMKTIKQLFEDLSTQ